MKALPESRKFRAASDGDGDVLEGETRALFASGQAKKEKRNSRLPRRYLCHEIPRETRVHIGRGLFSSGPPCRNTDGKAANSARYFHASAPRFALFRVESFLARRAEIRPDGDCRGCHAKPPSDSATTVFV